MSVKYIFSREFQLRKTDNLKTNQQQQQQNAQILILK